MKKKILREQLIILKQKTAITDQALNFLNKNAIHFLKQIMKSQEF